MGLIKAGMGALGGTLADQWKEFFYCEAMDKEVMVTKGQKRVSGRSSNTKGNDNLPNRVSLRAISVRALPLPSKPSASVLHTEEIRERISVFTTSIPRN